MSVDQKSTTRIRVAALIIEGDKILLAEHEKNGKRYWLLPGGGMEYGEPVEETLKREILEEAGIRIEVGDLLWVVDSIPENLSRHVLNLIVEAKALDLEITPHPDGVLRDMVWTNINSVPELTIFPDTRAEIISYYQSGERGKCLLGKRWNKA